MALSRCGALESDTEELDTEERDNRRSERRLSELAKKKEIWRSKQADSSETLYWEVSHPRTRRHRD